MAEEKKGPRDQSETDAKADAAKSARQVDREKVDPKTNQKFGDFLREHDDPQMQAAIERSDKETARGHLIAKMQNADRIIEKTEEDKEAKKQAEESLKSFEGRRELEEGKVQIPYELYRATENARIKAEAEAKQLDETVPGGRYYEGGRWVNCNGEPVE